MDFPGIDYRTLGCLMFFCPGIDCLIISEFVFLSYDNWFPDSLEIDALEVEFGFWFGFWIGFGFGFELDFDLDLKLILEIWCLKFEIGCLKFEIGWIEFGIAFDVEFDFGLNSSSQLDLDLNLKANWNGLDRKDD